jgi:hypothetical protein
MHMGRGSLRTAALALLVVGFGATVLSACTKNGATLARPDEAVVLQGSALPKLLGSDPMHVVGFAWNGSIWVQVPVQVDQRDEVNPGKIFNRPLASYATLPGGAPYTLLVYTNPQTASPGYSWTPTYTGVASHSGLGNVDEVSFLASDTGQVAPVSAGAPPNVVASTREQVRATDPLQSNQSGVVYLFHSDTLTGGGAGTTGVHYTFNLTSGDYMATYKMGTASQAPNNVAGPNPESSTVVTPGYTQHFGDRWLNDGITITRGGSTGQNILERSRVQVTSAGCSRTEDTFDDVVPSSPYEGAFIVNISGPVRAIRSHIGTNSGTYTTSTDIFYPTREDSSTELRVHSIPGVSVFEDLATSATGMTYFDDQNSSGFAIDGVPDTPVMNHAAPWQMVSGAQGSLVTAREVQTDIVGLTISTYYLDQNPASTHPCTGDAAAWGQHGTTVVGPGGSLPCTDPTLCAAANVLDSTRTRYFRKPALPVSTASNLAAQAASPLQTTVTG